MKARSTKFYVTFAIGAITGFSVCGWMLFSIGGAGGGTDSVRPGLNKVDRTVLEVNSNSPEQLDHSSLLPAPAPKSPPTLSKSLGAAGAGEGGQTRTPIVQELKAQDAEQMREAGEEERRREEEKRRELNQTFAQQQSSSSSPPLAISSPIPNDIAWKKNQTRVDNDLPPFDFRDSDVLAPGVHRVVRGIADCYRNDRFKFHFVHLPKNGGSSLVNNLRTLLCEAMGVGAGVEGERGKGEGGGGNKKEKSDCEARVLVQDKLCTTRPGYFSFAFIRNPWARAVSMWSYGFKVRTLKMPKHYIKKLKKTYCSFATFLDKLEKRGNLELCGKHARSHQWPVIVHPTGKAQFNFVGRLERFARDWTTVLQRIDPTGKLLELYKKLGFLIHNDSGHKAYTDYYNEELKAAVSRIWGEDVKKLGYAFVTERETFDATIKDKSKILV